MKFRLMLLALLLALAPASLWAGPLEDGVAAYNTGHYATALQHLRPLAEQGHAKAQFFLARMLDQGLGVKQDSAEALKWYRMAAERGSAQAEREMAWMYDYGRKVPRDYIQSYMWWTLAAAHGDDHATSDRAIVAARMTPAQIAEAERMAREWKPKQ